MSSSGVNLAEQRVNLHRKIAFPLVTLVMTFLAVPFGVTTGKKGTLYGIGLAIVLAFSYFLPDGVLPGGRARRPCSRRRSRRGRRTFSSWRERYI